MSDIWPYLSTEPFTIRYAMAAYLLRDCSRILEIGAHKTTIADFVTDKEVVLVGPHIEDKGQEWVTYEPYLFQEWAHTADEYGDYGLVMLGFDLYDLSDEDWERLYGFVDGSQRAVIELPRSNPNSRNIFDTLRKRIQKRISQRWVLNVLGCGNHSIRTFYLIED